MAKNSPVQLEFEMDKLTRSIENQISGDSFLTEISLLTQVDLKNTTKKSDWLFNWQKKFKQNHREVYKLTIINTRMLYRERSACL